MRGSVAAAAAALLSFLPGLLVEARVHSGAEFFANFTKILNHCYFVDRRYSTEHALKFAAPDYLACQTRCQNTTNCEFFGFWQDTQTCWLAGADAVFTDFLAKGGIAGPKVCPNPPAACAEVPGDGFPGANAEESKIAWPSHRVPEKLECWPKNVSGGFYDSCADVVVLEDTKNGWPGLCKGTHKVIVPWGETCESYCRKKVSCSVYQVMNDTGRSCYHSKLYGGSNCYMRNPENGIAPPLEAKRMMHGRIRILKDITGVQVMGLVQAFDENYFINVTRDAVPACRLNCYSNIGCQWWEYSKFSGCWVEDPRTPVPWPMTQQFWRTDTDFANTVIGGEYIQHVCPGKAGLPADYGYTVTGIPALQTTAAPAGQATFPGLPTQAPVETAVPSGTLQGALTIHGIYYGSLTEAQRQTLADNCTGSIASAVGVSKAWVKDEAGSPGQVSLASVVGGTHVGFLVDKPQGMTSNDVSRALLEPSFIGRVKGAAERMRSSGGQGEGFPTLEDVTVHSVVMETTPRPAAPVLPATTPNPSGLLPALPSEPPPLTPEQEGGLSMWFLALLVPAALVVCLGGFAYWYTQKNSSGGGRERKAKDKKSPGKGRKQRDAGEAPLLGNSPSESQETSSERDNFGMAASTTNSSLPPPSPPYAYTRGQDPQSGAPLAAGYDPKMKLEGAFDAASAARGAGVGPPAPANQDVRSSVLNAAFDIMDMNQDGVVSNSEFQQFNYGPGMPSMQPPNLAASMGPQLSASMGLRQPVLQTPGLQQPVATIPAPRPASMPVQALQSMPVQAGMAPMQGAPFAFRR